MNPTEPDFRSELSFYRAASDTREKMQELPHGLCGPRDGVQRVASMGTLGFPGK